MHSAVPFPPPGSPVYNDTSLCTYATCPIKPFGQLFYIPNLAGNILYLVIFSLALVLQCGLGYYYRTWGFLVAMAAGMVLEIIGYVGRIMLHNNVFDNNDFIIYLVGLTIGPAFYSAGIYLCLARVIAVFGASVSYFSPRNITLFFCGCDCMSLVLQAVGGALAADDNTSSEENTGVNIMIAGLSTQVASTSVFAVVCTQMFFTIRRNPHLVNPNSVALRRSYMFQFFLYGKSGPTLACLFIKLTLWL